MRIRNATLGDVPWLLEQLVALDRSVGVARSFFPPTLDAAERKVAWLVVAHPFFVAEEAERGRLGFLAGLLAPHLFSDRPTLSTIFWWVDEPFRGSRAGLLLLNHFVRFGREQGADVIVTLAETTPVNPDTLERRGFRAQETQYVMEHAA